MANYIFLKEWAGEELTWDDVITYGQLYETTVIPYPTRGSILSNIIAPIPNLHVEYINNSGSGIFSSTTNTSSIKWNCFKFTDSSNNKYITYVFGVPHSEVTCKFFGAEHLIYSTVRKYNRSYELSSSYTNVSTGNVINYYSVQIQVQDSHIYNENVPVIEEFILDPYSAARLEEARIKCLKAMDDNNWENTDDPYDPDGTSKPGGGGGDFDETSDPIDFPSLPTLSAVSTGFVNLYNPSLSQIQSLSSYLWGNLFDINQWKRLFADPMDAIIGLSIVPVSVPNSGELEITVGNIPTGIYAYKATAQWVNVDCGSIEVTEHWGAYLDYSPFTKFQLYLPFIGIVDLNTDDIMARTIHIKYAVDLLSGCCVAFVKCGEHILYTYNGQYAVNIPFTSSDWTGTLNSLITLGATALSGAVGAGMAVGSEVLNENTTPEHLMMVGASSMKKNSSASADLVTNSKVNIKRGGSLGSSVGLMSRRKPYLIRTNPNQCVPKTQNVFTGYPSYIRVLLSSCNGFTIVEEMHLENVHATNEELVEIENILKGGVYI